MESTLPQRAGELSECCLGTEKDLAILEKMLTVEAGIADMEPFWECNDTLALTE